MKWLEKIRLKSAIKKIGEKVLENTNQLYELLGNYIELLKTDQEKLVCGYLYIVKVLSSYDEETRNKIIELLKDTDYKSIGDVIDE